MLVVRTRFAYSGLLLATGAAVTKYCYDGDYVVADYNSAGVLQRKYIYGPGIDEPIMMVVVNGGETKYYYHYVF